MFDNFRAYCRGNRILEHDGRFCPQVLIDGTDGSPRWAPLTAYGEPHSSLSDSCKVDSKEMEQVINSCGFHSMETAAEAYEKYLDLVEKDKKSPVKIHKIVTHPKIWRILKQKESK